MPVHLVAIALLIAVLAASLARGQVEESAWLLYHDPELPTPGLKVVFPPGLAKLWQEALKRPERDLKRRAASTIGTAYQHGASGMESTVPQLEKMLSQPDQERTVRLTVARTLIKLDARQSAPLLLESLTENDLDMAETVEPALARWSYMPARDMWLARVKGKVVFRRAYILAIQGLTALDEASAIPLLLDRALDQRVPTSIRLAAADGLGQLAETELVPSVRELVKAKTPAAFLQRLVAVRMLAGHRGRETEQLLVELATDPMPSVQTVALRQLHQIDPELVMPLVEQLVGSVDVNVRRSVAESLIAVARKPVRKNIALLSPLLDDPNPSLRRLTCDALIDLAKLDGFQPMVISEGQRVLGEQGWRGQEQAIRLLVALDEKSTVDKLLELLDSPRPEVHTSAAWGLCELSVPSTVEKIFAVFEKKTELWLTLQPQTPETEIQLSHLAQAIGKMKYAPAETVLRKYITKESPLMPVSRAASIWALGHLHAGVPDDALVSKLRSRMMDITSDAPEDPLVRRFAAITLGRMKAEQTLGSLKSVIRLEGIRAGTGIAAAWAIHEITGAPLPEVPPRVFQDDNWFLVPQTSSLPNEAARD